MRTAMAPSRLREGSGSGLGTLRRRNRDAGA